MTKNKVYEVIVNGRSDNNIKYSDLIVLAEYLGFIFQRQRGSHEIYYHPAINEFLNLQAEGNKAKGYQVRQLRGIILAHKL